MHEKYYFGENCPKCGSLLTVRTDCNPDLDTETDYFVAEGDEVFCDCGFKSSLVIDENGEGSILD
jgi:hypothetical protein